MSVLLPIHVSLAAMLHGSPPYGNENALSLCSKEGPKCRPVIRPRSPSMKERVFVAKLRLLRARRERPHHRSAAEQRDEIATFHSITSSAVASSVGGTVRSSIRAVW